MAGFSNKWCRNAGTDPRGIGDEGEHQNTYLLPLRSFNYTQKGQESAMKMNKNYELVLLWLSMPKGKDVSRSGARPESQQPGWLAPAVINSR